MARPAERSISFRGGGMRTYYSQTLHAAETALRNMDLRLDDPFEMIAKRKYYNMDKKITDDVSQVVVHEP